MACQRDIARKIVDKKADYILALKGNQGSLREDAELFADEQIVRGFADIAIIRVRKGGLSVKVNLKAAAWNDSHLIRLLIA